MSLIACPFCGQTPDLHQIGQYTIEIVCPCGIRIKQRVKRCTLDWLMGKMIENWNTREGSR